MEKLLEQLLDRWELAFDQLETLGTYKAQVVTTRYSAGSRYNLDRFDWNSFPSDGPMVNNKGDIDAISLHEYGFNAEGRPCYTAFKHDYNQIFWEGFYTYSDTLVEYVEFCLTTGVPSALMRMQFREHKKISFQSIIINGRGSGYPLSDMSKEEIINKIKNDGFSVISTVTRYDYDSNGRIEKASNIHITPGLGKFTSYDEYTYDNDQSLDTIRTFFEQGTNRLTYSKLTEGMSPESLTESLAEAMARSVSETLADQNIEQPIAFLELSYHYADNYSPILVWHTAQDVADKVASNEFDFIPDYSDTLQVETRPFEILFAQLQQMMQELNNSNLGRILLRKAAYLLTKNALFGKVNVSDDFAAYAIDWSIEGHSNESFEEILRECGVRADVIEIWKQKGILPA